MTAFENIVIGKSSIPALIITVILMIVIPVAFFDAPIDVVGDTVAMSTPHEIDYAITFLSETIREAE